MEVFPKKNHLQGLGPDEFPEPEQKAFVDAGAAAVFLCVFFFVSFVFWAFFFLR